MEPLQATKKLWIIKVIPESIVISRDIFSEATAENEEWALVNQEDLWAMKTLKYDGEENAVSSFEIDKGNRTFWSVLLRLMKWNRYKEAFITMLDSTNQKALKNMTLI